MSKICIFDVDGTLTESTKEITDEMLQLLRELKNKDVQIVVVAGGSYHKVASQLKDLELFDKIYTECGAVYYENNSLVFQNNFTDHCDRQVLNSIIKQALREISEMDIVYSGMQTDFRKGLVYISPVGQQATDRERSLFMEMDKKYDTRRKLIEALKKIDTKDEFDLVLGGNVGISLYPKGWNKGQVMKYFHPEQDEIYFFGDRTDEDGNDYHIYKYPGVKGYHVDTYHDTMRYLRNLFFE